MTRRYLAVVPPNKHMLRARVLMRWRAGADVNRWATLQRRQPFGPT
jgi:hypothetical protein